MDHKAQRDLSVLVFSVGICLGVLGCLAAPKAIFTLGINDCTSEWIAAFLCPTTFMPTCILALWRRRIAGVWFLVLTAIWIYAMIAERHYMTTVRRFPDQGTPAFLETLLPACVLLFFGLFALGTERAGWPRIIKRAEQAS